MLEIFFELLLSTKVKTSLKASGGFLREAAVGNWPPQVCRGDMAMPGK